MDRKIDEDVETYSDSWINLKEKKQSHRILRWLILPHKKNPLIFRKFVFLYGMCIPLILKKNRTPRRRKNVKWCGWIMRLCGTVRRNIPKNGKLHNPPPIHSIHPILHTLSPGRPVFKEPWFLSLSVLCLFVCLPAYKATHIFSHIFTYIFTISSIFFSNYRIISAFRRISRIFSAFVFASADRRIPLPPRGEGGKEGGVWSDHAPSQGWRGRSPALKFLKKDRRKRSYPLFCGPLGTHPPSVSRMGPGPNPPPPGLWKSSLRQTERQFEV